MFTVLGGFRVSLIKSQCPLCMLALFFPGDLSRINRGTECSRTDAISYENTFLPDYKLPDAS